jgi:hypothetical protein
MQKYGVVIVSFFAALWFLWGLSAAPVPVWLTAVPILMSGGMILRATQMPPAPAPRKHAGAVIGWASAGEGIAISIAANILQWLGLETFLVCAVAAIVGLHFIPFIWVLRQRFYILPLLGFLTIAALGCAIADPVLRLRVVAISSATLLWGAGLASLARRGGYIAGPAEGSVSAQ